MLGGRAERHSAVCWGSLLGETDIPQTDGSPGTVTHTGHVWSCQGSECFSQRLARGSTGPLENGWAAGVHEGHLFQVAQEGGGGQGGGRRPREGDGQRCPSLSSQHPALGGETRRAAWGTRHPPEALKLARDHGVHGGSPLTSPGRARGAWSSVGGNA